MKELVFSIEEIFDRDSSQGCLRQYDSTGYYIPTYQRGYKWGTGPDGAVTKLLLDLWDAYKRQDKKEYYLQYITVKQRKVKLKHEDTEQQYLEVIDGQQRLTTLSILVSVLAMLLETPKNYSVGKLHYAIRDDFFTDHIYDSNKLNVFTGKKWQERMEDGEANGQDLHYLHAAARHLRDKLEPHHKDERQAFADYLAKRVKLIVNSVESQVPSETVFHNLNSYKEPLTETELIKAVLITKVGRACDVTGRKAFKEVMETRLHLGRLWDEMSRWANTPEINTFFFNGHADDKDRPQGMWQLLQLAAVCLPKSRYKLQDPAPTTDKGRELVLFNFYHQYPDVQQLYNTLKEVQATLADWYADTETHNLLGFCRFVKNSKSNNLRFLEKCLRQVTKSTLKQFLNETRVALLPEARELGNLTYEVKENHGSIHAVLLAMSVFPQALEPQIRFNFHAFKSKSWSLEHIFPQSPEGNGTDPLDPDQRAAVAEMLGDRCDAALTQMLDKAERSEEEKELYRSVLQTLPHLNAIGNMCLLTTPDNSSNGCLFFKAKRGNVLRLVQRGSFVPKHTFDVFSKMMPGLTDSNIAAWTVKDIDAHAAHIEQRISALLSL